MGWWGKDGRGAGEIVGRGRMRGVGGGWRKGRAEGLRVGTMGHGNILTAKTEFSIAGLRTGARFW